LSGNVVQEEAWTYPAVPIVPKVGHSDIKANTESEGSNKNGGYVDTYEVRAHKQRGRKKIGFGLTVSLDERVVKGCGELLIGG